MIELAELYEQHEALSARIAALPEPDDAPTIGEERRRRMERLRLKNGATAGLLELRQVEEIDRDLAALRERRTVLAGIAEELAAEGLAAWKEYERAVGGNRSYLGFRRRRDEAIAAGDLDAAAWAEVDMLTFGGPDERALVRRIEMLRDAHRAVVVGAVDPTLPHELARRLPEPMVAKYRSLRWVQGRIEELEGRRSAALARAEANLK